MSEPGSSPITGAGQPTEDATVHELREELRLTRQRLQSITEEFETSREEMRASNRELQSINQELREAEERYLALFNAIDQGFCTIQVAFDKHDRPIDYCFLEVSPSFERQTGIPNAAGRWMREIAPDQDELWFEIYGQVALTGNPRRFEAGSTPLDRWWTVYAFRIQDPSLRRIAVLFYDISERKRAEAALRDREEHLQLILNSARDYAIITLTPDRTITDWNIGAERILGYGREEAVGRSGDMIFTPEDRTAGEPQSEVRTAEEEGRAQSERWHLRRDGTRFWGSGMAMPLREPGGEIRGFLKIMIDNTQRRRMEEDLRQAKDQAEQAARAKEDFLAHMSHEIRTPLNVIIGFSNLLLDQNPQPEQLESLKTLQFAARNLRMLVDDILDFSKIRSGQMAVQEKDVDLRDLLYSLKQAHQLLAGEQGTELRVRVDERIPSRVRTDQLKLSQVLNNLISNAVKFTTAGTVTVEAVLNRREGKRLWLDVSVRDTGIGIPREKLNTIFDAFTQVDSSTARPYEGTGLGLAITRSLLELLGSRIEAESEAGAGSRFFFTLPVTPTEAGSTVDPPPAAVLKKRDLSHLRVLLAEDVPMNRLVFRQFLRDLWGIRLDEAANGLEAVQMAEVTRYDLILMDVRMPVMDGYEAARAIRALGRHNTHVPILALTADTVREVERHVEVALLADVVTKPFEPEELLRKIVQHAGRWGEPELPDF